MIVIAAKHWNVPLGDMLPDEVEGSILEMAREFPYWLEKWIVMAQGVAKARMRNGKSSAVSKYSLN